MVVVVCAREREQIFAQKEGGRTINMIIYIFIVGERARVQLFEKGQAWRDIYQKRMEREREKHNLSAEMSIACQC
jgi:hypothetical protein